MKSLAQSLAQRKVWHNEKFGTEFGTIKSLAQSLAQRKSLAQEKVWHNKKFGTGKKSLAQSLAQ